MSEAVYRKAIRLPAVLNKGDMTALFSSDTEKLKWAFQTLNFVWAPVIALIVTFVALFMMLGYSAFVCLALVIALWPFNKLISWKFTVTYLSRGSGPLCCDISAFNYMHSTRHCSPFIQSIQDVLMATHQERLKVVSEVLQGNT